MILYSMLLGTAAGSLAAVVYFGGLWWTVQRLAAARRTGWWLVFSFLARFLLFSGSTIFAFATAPNPVSALIGILAGFVMVREVAKRKIGNGHYIRLKEQP